MKKSDGPEIVVIEIDFSWVVRCVTRPAIRSLLRRSFQEGRDTKYCFVHGRYLVQTLQQSRGAHQSGQRSLFLRKYGLSCIMQYIHA